MSDPTLGIDTVNPDPKSAASTTDPKPSDAAKTYDLTKPILNLPQNITVRQPRHSDAAEQSRLANNIKLSRVMTKRWPFPYTVDHAHDWIAMCRNEANWRKIGPTDPESQNTVGVGQKLPTSWTIAVNDVTVGGIGAHFQEDVASRVARFGYWLGEEHWRKGIMGIVLPAWIEWFWETYPWMIKLEPGVYGWNPASSKLLEKCGFVLEGRQRCAIERFGVVGDLLLYAMIREGFEGSDKPPEHA